MKLQELNDICGRLVKLRHGDDEIVIKTACGGIPTNLMVPVKGVSTGSDWTKGKFLIHSETPMVPSKILGKPVSQLARERLAVIKEAYSKMKFNYLPKAHESSWIDGFQSGVRCFVTSLAGGAGSWRKDWRPQNPEEAAVMARCLVEVLELTESWVSPATARNAQREAELRGRAHMLDVVLEMLAIVTGEDTDAEPTSTDA